MQQEYNQNPKALAQTIKLYEDLLHTQKLKSDFTDFKNEINECPLPDEEKLIVLLSAIYYKIVKSLKGEHALYLEQNLRKDLEKDLPEFIVPEYINQALKSVLE